MMNENDHAEGYDRTHDGNAMIALLQRHAPSPPDVESAREAVLTRLPQSRLFSLRWAGPAVGAAAAVLIAVMLFTHEAPQLAPQTGHPATPAAQGDALPRLVAVVRGPSRDGWRIDAGLQDGLRVGNRLSSHDSEYTVAAVGIFDARVIGAAPLSRGERLWRPLDTVALQRAATMAPLGGDPGGLFAFGAVLDTLPVTEARLFGIADGRALIVTETIPAVLRDFEAAPEPTLAGRLGLRTGDVLIQVNGYQVADFHQLANALDWSRRSGGIQATVIRDRRTLELSTR